MKKAEQRDLTPPELWDQLAVTQIQKQLAPNGFKKIHNGKREVSALQFLPRETVNRASLIGANLVRLFRENLKEALQDRLKGAQDLVAVAMTNLTKCKPWQFRQKRMFRKEITYYSAQASLLSALIDGDIQQLKPSAPKPKQSKAEKAFEQVKEFAKGTAK